MAQSLYNDERMLQMLKEHWKDELVGYSKTKDLLTLDMKKQRIAEIMEFLKINPQCQFQFLVDETAIDYLHFSQTMPERFAVVYILYSFQWDYRLRIRVFLPMDDLTVDSLSSVFQAANWMEREIFELFGIHFRHHPDLKRLLTPDNFPNFPLRKDYPLQGLGERSDFPKYKEEPLD